MGREQDCGSETYIDIPDPPFLVHFGIRVRIDIGEIVFNLK